MMTPIPSIPNVMFPVLMEDENIHTATCPFCAVDSTCPCHEDQTLIRPVQAALELGVLTPERATAIIAGMAAYPDWLRWLS